MSRISRDEVLRIAALARLRLEGAEAEAMTGHLEAILDYVALLEEVDVEGVEPTAHVIPFETPVRADEPGGELAPEDFLANAPAARGTAFAVPRVLDTEAEG